MLGVLTIVLLSFYMLVDAEEIHVEFVRFFPEDRRAQVSRIIGNSTSKVGAWLGGQLLLGLIIGSSTALGFYLIGVPYFYVLALICGLGELIPIVGPMLAAVPALLVAASAGDRAHDRRRGVSLGAAVHRESRRRAATSCRSASA